MLRITFSAFLIANIIGCSSPTANEDDAKKPAGDMLAFESSVKHNRDIFIMDADGKNVRNLTNDSAVDVEPCWSPDGKYVAFSSNRDDKKFDLYKTDIATGETTRLTSDTSSMDAQPTWSPDGNCIAFMSDREKGKYGIFILDMKTMAVTPYTSGAGDYSQPSWSPDGKQLAFIYNADYRKTQNWDVYTNNFPAGADEMKKLTTYDGTDFSPTWHPSLNKIIFMSIQNNNEDLYEIDLNTMKIAQLTTEKSSEDMPSISPDGKYIAFMQAGEKNGKETHEIGMITADGKTVQIIGDSLSPDRSEERRVGKECRL